MSLTAPFGVDLTVVLVCWATTSIAIEFVILRSRRVPVAVHDSVQSAVFGLTWAVLRVFGAKAAWFGTWVWVYTNGAIFDWDMSNPLSWVAYWLLGDLVYYWTHRAEHRVRALWCSHLVHHSSEHFNLATAVRQPWTEAMYKPIIAMWAPLLGFHPAIYVVFGTISLAIGQWQHLAWFPRVSIIDAVFMSPSNHRVHHGRNHEYLDKNFGGSLVIWDKLFGTYVPETTKPEYGILHVPETNGRLSRLLGGYPELAADLRSAAGPVAATKIALGRPT